MHKLDFMTRISDYFKPALCCSCHREQQLWFPFILTALSVLQEQGVMGWGRCTENLLRRAPHTFSATSSLPGGCASIALSARERWSTELGQLLFFHSAWKQFCWCIHRQNLYPLPRVQFKPAPRFGIWNYLRFSTPLPPAHRLLLLHRDRIAILAGPASWHSFIPWHLRLTLSHDFSLSSFRRTVAILYFLPISECIFPSRAAVQAGRCSRLTHSQRASALIGTESGSPVSHQLTASGAP